MADSLGGGRKPSSVPEPAIRRLGRRPLSEVWASMQAFTAQRTPETVDEIWFVEHPPVFTLGLRADRAHLLDPGDIPVVQIDRGGQVTYHGPGQLVVYTLLDLGRLGLNVRSLVQALEILPLFIAFPEVAAHSPDGTRR